MWNFSVCLEELYMDTKADGACLSHPVTKAIVLAPTLCSFYFLLLHVFNDILIAVSSGPPFISRYLHNYIFSSVLWLDAQLLHATCNILHFPCNDLRDILFLKPHYCQLLKLSLKLLKGELNDQQPVLMVKLTYHDGGSFVLQTKMQKPLCCDLCLEAWGLLHLCWFSWLLTCCSYPTFFSFKNP